MLDRILLTLPLTNIATESLQFGLSVDQNEGDGLVTATDRTGPTAFRATGEINAGDEVLTIDITQAVRQALNAGQTRITARLEAPFAAVAPLTSFVRTVLPGEGPSLHVTRKITDGVVGDLYHESGLPIAISQSSIPLNATQAGTYFLKVYNPDPSKQTQDLSFEIAIKAPIAGSSHESDGSPDRDRVSGGEGEDVVIGNNDLDRLFGDSGDDLFIGEAIELRDAQDNELADNNVPLAQFSNRPQFEPDRRVDFADDVLEGVVAHALGMPVTLSYQGNPLAHEPIFASDLARLTRLDVSGWNITDLGGTEVQGLLLGGLEQAVNLTSLSLSRNNISDIFDLVPRRDNTGTVVGLGRLEHLGVDYNPLTDTQVFDTSSGETFSDLSLLGELLALRSLSLDGMPISDPSALITLEQLELLSIDHTGQTSLSITEPGLDALFDNLRSTGGSFVNGNGEGLVENRTHDAIDFDSIFDEVGGSGLFNFASRWTGQVDVSDDTETTFALRSSQGAQLYIDNQLVIDSPGPHGFITATNTIALSQGLHDLRVEYYTDPEQGGINLSYTTPGTPLQILSTTSLNAAPALVDVSSLAGFENLRVLSLAHNAIENVQPLAGLDHLEILNLGHNNIRNIESLVGQKVIDDGDDGYAEFGEGFQGNLNPFDGAFEGDYRFRLVDGPENFATQWTFEDLPVGNYEVLVTWPENDSRSTAVTYTFTVEDLSQTVDGLDLFQSITEPSLPPALTGGDVVIIDTDAFTIDGDDNDPNTFYGTAFDAQLINGIWTLFVDGDLHIPADSITVGFAHAARARQAAGEGRRAGARGRARDLRRQRSAGPRQRGARGLLGSAGGDHGGAQRRLVSYRRRWRDRRGWLPDDLRSQEGRDHHRRRERVVHRGRGCDVLARRGGRGGGDRRARRKMGRDDQGAGGAATGVDTWGQRRRQTTCPHRALPGAHRPLQVPHDSRDPFRPAPHRDRQAAEVQAARAVLGRPRSPGELSTERRCDRATDRRRHRRRDPSRARAWRRRRARWVGLGVPAALEARYLLRVGSVLALQSCVFEEGVGCVLGRELVHLSTSGPELLTRLDHGPLSA